VLNDRKASAFLHATSSSEGYFSRFRRKVLIAVCSTAGLLFVASGVVAQPLAGPTLTSLTRERLPANSNDCEQAGEAAEREYGLPAGLLLAIGRIESGRKDPQTGRHVPWPWAVNAEGLGTFFSTHRETLTHIHALQARGMKSIDVGCFQINLLHHPEAFLRTEDALDASRNAKYAAQFLASLYARRGSWRDAISAYHSAHPERGLAYSARVFASWGKEGRNGVAFEQQSHTADPAIAFSTFRPPVRVWRPGGNRIIPGFPQVIGPSEALANPRFRE
jgi:hypothetical protein